jgi:hypothetical protein
MAQARQVDRQSGPNMSQSSHEVFSRDEKVVAGSDRSFGLVMAAVLLAVTSLNDWHSGSGTAGQARLSAGQGVADPGDDTIPLAFSFAG